MTMKLATIVPSPSKSGQPTPTMGTKVVLADGTELQGIQRIELVAEVGCDFWRAKIECFVSVPKIEGVEIIESEVPKIPQPIGWKER